MIKQNKLRKAYLIYWTVLSELYGITMLLSVPFVRNELLQIILKISSLAAIFIVPIFTYAIYKWKSRDNASTSDELEQNVLQKSSATTGLTALSLIPFLILFAFRLSEFAGYFVLGYAVIVGGVFKLGTFYYYKKY